MGPENRPGIRAQSQDKQAVESKRLQAVRGIEVKKVLRLQGTQLLAFAATGDAIQARRSNRCLLCLERLGGGDCYIQIIAASSCRFFVSYIPTIRWRESNA